MDLPQSLELCTPASRPCSIAGSTRETPRWRSRCTRRACRFLCACSATWKPGSTRPRPTPRRRSSIPAVYLTARLAPDMLPLPSQIQIACDAVKFGVARLAGVEAPKFEDDEASLADLRARIRKTIDFVQSVPAAQIDGTENKDVVVPRRDGCDDAQGRGLPEELRAAELLLPHHDDVCAAAPQRRRARQGRLSRCAELSRERRWSRRDSAALDAAAAATRAPSLPAKDERRDRVEKWRSTRAMRPVASPWLRCRAIRLKTSLRRCHSSCSERAARRCSRATSTSGAARSSSGVAEGGARRAERSGLARCRRRLAERGRCPGIRSARARARWRCAVARAARARPAAAPGRRRRRNRQRAAARRAATAWGASVCSRRWTSDNRIDPERGAPCGRVGTRVSTATLAT